MPNYIKDLLNDLIELRERINDSDDMFEEDLFVVGRVLDFIEDASNFYHPVASVKCPHCGRELFPSTHKCLNGDDYDYQCYYCDEDFYKFEVIKEVK